MAELDDVTGAYSFTGRHIAEALLERGRRVRTLTRRPHPEHPLASRLETSPLVFDERLVASLEGADTLYNTYWVRFERGSTTFTGAVDNTTRLFGAAERAGVRRIVHISVANPDPESPFPYFRGKARTEQALRAAGISYAVVRPTLVFGPADILVNNIAWALRRLPFFLVVSDGRAQVQPVSVHDTARICVEVGARPDDVIVDAAGPDRWVFEEFVQLIRRAVGGRARVVRSGPSAALAVARIAGTLLRDVVVTRDELSALRSGLLVSHEPPRGTQSFEAWLHSSAAILGRRYESELARNFRP